MHEWLSNAYWSPGVSYERVLKAMEFSALVVGAYDNDMQVGYMRLVSDRTTFAWVSDVIVDESYRGQGIARAMVRFAMEHPDVVDVRRWCLATRDAHEVYRPLGFAPLTYPDHFMWIGPQSPPKPSQQ
ncbi:MAG: GNAT family N-acetyltransferase [Bacteroidetes bacterium]|nr:GNAT family N-acetyltransferase [Bacteroidota bacterium]